MSTGPDQSAELKFVVTNTLIVGDVQRSVAFYRDVLGATVLREGEPTFLRLGNIWLTINGGSGGTDDKPDVVVAPPRDPDGYLIEVGQTTMTADPLDLYA
jgi:predicted enzyme related to lactoylglutathione lyase